MLYSNKQGLQDQQSTRQSWHLRVPLFDIPTQLVPTFGILSSMQQLPIEREEQVLACKEWKAKEAINENKTLQI